MNPCIIPAGPRLRRASADRTRTSTQLFLGTADISANGSMARPERWETVLRMFPPPPCISRWMPLGLKPLYCDRARWLLRHAGQQSPLPLPKTGEVHPGAIYCTALSVFLAPSLVL